MIFRRIKAHIQKENWFAVFLDFLIVVVGVFIGIQVANWNEASGERRIERETLVRLHGDIVQSIVAQDRDLVFLSGQIDWQQVVLKSLDACEVSEHSELAVQRGLATLGWINPPQLYRRTIDQITSSGRSDLIQSEEIKQEISSLVALVEWRGSAYEFVTSILLANLNRIQPMLHYDIDQAPVEKLLQNYSGSVVYDIDVMCADPSIASAVSAISYQTADRLRDYQPILESLKRIRSLIADELETRWQFNPERVNP